jgi:DNA (cytosine-5)-methyltransferase 1
VRHASLFSGIGGFDLAAQWMGWENVFHCEIKEFCRTILKYYWVDAISHEDIRRTNFTVYRGKVDVLSGGFPCQPYSVAGLRKGKDDERHLWPEMLRAVAEIQPSFVVGENVRGLINWNGGLVFDEVQNNLENLGYEVTPFEIPAIGVGADHVRERIWFIAHSGSLGWKDLQSHTQRSSDADSHTQRSWQDSQWWSKEANDMDSSCNTFLRFQKMYGQPAIYDVDDGLPFKLDGITIPKWIEESCTAGGNAIVPQIAFEIFKAIEMTMKEWGGGSNG